MISLSKLFEEISKKPKAIITAGGASVGKSTVLKGLDSQLKDFNNLNVDKYVEDENSPMHGNLGAASSKIRKEDLPNAIENRDNLIYDTTASNLKTLQPTLDALKSQGYDVMMIMVYAHPIVSFLRNFKRERKVPAVGVLKTWIKVYNLIEEYKKIFGVNFVLVTSPTSNEEKKAIDEFHKQHSQGRLREYFEELLSSGNYSSTFKKSDDGLSPEELEKKNKARAKTQEILNQSIDQIEDSFDKIQTNLDFVDVSTLPNIVNKFIQ